ncbi:suppressor of fused domain protein [Paenibacillus turicensis]|uniref:suppressor of fused domain protein n=1 Tax=Paenibacillus turicensis TaxID=160487 RepID=UPI003D27A824
MHTESSKEDILAFDIRRTIILGAYIKEWSMPEYRVTLSSFGQPNKGTNIEIYYFPARSGNGVARFATVGLSAVLRANGQHVGTEWMMALVEDLGGVSVDIIFSYISDLIAHHIEVVNDDLIPRVMEESQLAPSGWSTKAFLLDELRGESEELEEIAVGSELVRLLWALPITAQEAALILSEGVEAFDSYIEGIQYSIIDPRRP